MSGAIAHDQAERLRAALAEAFGDEVEPAGPASTTRDTFLRLVEVLETSPDAVVLPVDATVTTQQAADLLGISRMTVVRLIDRGELTTEGGGVHRRITAAELARYRSERSTGRRTALHDLAAEIGDATPADQVISTR